QWACQDEQSASPAGHKRRMKEEQNSNCRGIEQSFSQALLRALCWNCAFLSQTTDRDLWQQKTSRGIYLLENVCSRDKDRTSASRRGAGKGRMANSGSDDAGGRHAAAKPAAAPPATVGGSVFFRAP